MGEAMSSHMIRSCYNGIDMCGRNGTVKYNSHSVIGWSPRADTENHVALDLYSKKIGKQPPVYFYGNVLEMIDLFEQIVKDLHEKKLEMINEKMGIKTI